MPLSGPVAGASQLAGDLGADGAVVEGAVAAVGGDEDLHDVVQEQQQPGVPADPHPHRPVGERRGQRRVRLHLPQHPQVGRGGDERLDELSAVAGVGEAALADAVEVDEVGGRRAAGVGSAGVGHAGREVGRWGAPARGVEHHLVAGEQRLDEEDGAEDQSDEREPRHVVRLRVPVVPIRPTRRRTASTAAASPTPATVTQAAAVQPPTPLAAATGPTSWAPTPVSSIR